MIDLNAETPLSLAQAAQRIPSSRLGKPTHVSTLVRWILHGVRGVKLEAARIGGRWVTSQEALERFSAALTAQHLPESASAEASTHSQRDAHRRQQERVEQELAAMGL
jgi:hypothetical protein